MWITLIIRCKIVDNHKITYNDYLHTPTFKALLSVSSSYELKYHQNLKCWGISWESLCWSVRAYVPTRACVYARLCFEWLIPHFLRWDLLHWPLGVGQCRDGNFGWHGGERSIHSASKKWAETQLARHSHAPHTWQGRQTSTHARGNTHKRALLCTPTHPPTHSSTQWRTRMHISTVTAPHMDFALTSVILCFIPTPASSGSKVRCSFWGPTNTIFVALCPPIQSNALTLSWKYWGGIFEIGSRITTCNIQILVANKW